MSCLHCLKFNNCLKLLDLCSKIQFPSWNYSDWIENLLVNHLGNRVSVSVTFLIALTKYLTRATSRRRISLTYGPGDPVHDGGEGMLLGTKGSPEEEGAQEVGPGCETPRATLWSTSANEVPHSVFPRSPTSWGPSAQTQALGAISHSNCSRSGGLESPVTLVSKFLRLVFPVLSFIMILTSDLKTQHCFSNLVSKLLILRQTASWSILKGSDPLALVS